jgi:hypothetical protein
MNRRTLIAALAVLGVFGLVFVAWPFVASFSPSATAGETLPHLDVRALRPGEYAYFNGGSIGRWSQYKYLVLRQFDGSYDVLGLQTKDGKFLMPDYQFWNMSGTCDHFSLPMPSGYLAPDGELRCLDSKVDGANNDNWRWNYKGRNINRTFSDFQRPPFVVDGNEIVVGKWR